MKLSSGLLAAVLTILADGAQADIIYNNGLPNYHLGEASDPDTQFSADDFVLGPVGTVVTGIRWWGNFNGVIPTEYEFTVSFFEAIPGVVTDAIPALSPFAEYSLGALAPTSSVQQSSDTYFQYDAAIAPLELAPSTTYYISITNSTPLSPTKWRWTASGLDTLDFFSRMDDTDPWRQNSTTNLAFQLLGSPPVPEPATISLLGMGLAGLALRARRKRTA